MQSSAFIESLFEYLDTVSGRDADSVRKQLKDLGELLNIDLCPVFISRKIGEDLKQKEIKPALINEQLVVNSLNPGIITEGGIT